MSERIYEDNVIKVRRGREKLSDHIDIKTDNWSVGSKKKLKSSLRHKFRKSIANILDELDKEQDEGNIDEDTRLRIRSKVLNIINSQIRNVETELDSRYNIEALNYHIRFIVGGEGK